MITLSPQTNGSLAPRGQGSPIYIYALKDPFTDQIRYIGKSIRPHERLMNECNERVNTHRSHWIQSVLARGQRPIQIILETLPHDAHWQSCEQMWIAYGRAQGWPLTNGTNGGDGVPGVSGDSLARMRATWIGRKHKPESLLKMAAASRGRKHTPEWCEYMRGVLKGREFTDEHRKRLSEGVRKLSDEQVAEIKERLAQGALVKDLAAFYGVHRTTLSKIKTDQYLHERERREQKHVVRYAICKTTPHYPRTLFDLLSNPPSEEA